LAEEATNWKTDPVAKAVFAARVLLPVYLAAAAAAAAQLLQVVRGLAQEAGEAAGPNLQRLASNLSLPMIAAAEQEKKKEEFPPWKAHRRGVQLLGSSLLDSSLLMQHATAVPGQMAEPQS
jgi:hypothetical protein